jgi:small subunit ribosomal protein S1
MTELSWKRNTKLKDVYKKGDKVSVKIIGIDKDANRISLSIRQLTGDPWETVADRWTAGTVVKGPITNITEFGAFVELEPGIEGLIHIRDISWQRIKHPKDVFRKGQEVEVEILHVDTVLKRIGLGYRQLNDPWRKAAQKYSKGQEITVKVVRLANFGAFVELEEGIEGLIHISQFSVKRVEKPEDVLSEGQEVNARIIEINPEQRRMRLSIKQIEEETQGVHKQEEERRPKPPRPERQRETQSNNYAQDEEPSMTIGDIFRAQQGQ